MGRTLGLRVVPLTEIRPSELNCRLYVDTDNLRDLQALYTRYLAGESVHLPDAPRVRPVVEEGKTSYELLAGERRLTAARLAGVPELEVVVEEMTDEEAFLFQLQHNNTKGLTTVELAYRAAEMQRLGFQNAEIKKALGGIAVYRYITVGRLIDRDWFSDAAKKCDPHITDWYGAAAVGKRHFKYCFYHWNSGEWDAATCRMQFRRKGVLKPKDAAERGFRVSTMANRMVLRGTLDLDQVTLDEADLMLTTLQQVVESAKNRIAEQGMFGPRQIELINPETVTYESQG